VELKKLAQLTIKAINETPSPDKPQVTLVFPGRKWTTGTVLHLGAFGTGPAGTVTQETDDGPRVVFDAIDVLAWLIAAGVVESAKAEA
jgi:hypothetical protein